MTQIQGEGGQDALNFPGRLDNQLVVLYGNIANSERRMGTPITERVKDLRPITDKILGAARTAPESGRRHVQWGCDEGGNDTDRCEVRRLSAPEPRNHEGFILRGCFKRAAFS